MAKSKPRPFVSVRLSWIDEAEATRLGGHSRGLTAYAERDGIEGLFSVYAQFSADASEATVFALVPAVDSRLPAPGGALVLTAGPRPIARALVTATGSKPLD